MEEGAEKVDVDAMYVYDAYDMHRAAYDMHRASWYAQRPNLKQAGRQAGREAGRKGRTAVSTAAQFSPSALYSASSEEATLCGLHRSFARLRKKSFENVAGSEVEAPS